MVGHGGSSAGSYLANPTSPIPSHCASIVVTSTLRVNILLKSCHDLVMIPAIMSSYNGRNLQFPITAMPGNTYLVQPLPTRWVILIESSVLIQLVTLAMFRLSSQFFSYPCFLYEWLLITFMAKEVMFSVMIQKLWS